MVVGDASNRVMWEFYRVRTWRKLTSFYASPSYVAERITTYLATDLTQGEAQPMDDERIEIHWFGKKELDEMIRCGKIEDAKTMIDSIGLRPPSLEVY